MNQEDLSSIVSTPTLSAPQSEFAKQKVQISIPIEMPGRQKASASQVYVKASGQDKVESTVTLAILIDNQCVAAKNKTVSDILKSHFVVKDATMALRRQAYRAVTHSGVTAQMIDQFAQNESCIVGITNNTTFKVAFTNDPDISSQEHFKTIGGEAAYKTVLGREVAAQHKVKVAVIDTGVSVEHPDLSRVIAKKDGQNMGWDFILQTNQMRDEHGHGSHVAGLIAASTNNGVGVSGTCFNNCEIIPYRILDKDGKGDITLIFNAIQMAVKEGADVANLSLGYSFDVLVDKKPLETEMLRDALNNNLVVLIAAGNDSMELGFAQGQQKMWPALYGQLQGVMTVASMNTRDEQISEFSNYSPSYVDIAAPGSVYFSRAEKVDTGLLSTHLGNGYKRLSGTSMATPVMAGVVGNVIAHLKESSTSYTPASVESFILENSPSKNEFLSKTRGGKRLDMQKIGEALGAGRVIPAVKNIDPLVDFVDSVYAVAFKRSGDQGGLDYWARAIRGQQTTVEDFFTSMFESQEYINMIGMDTRVKPAFVNTTVSYNVDHFYVPTMYYLMFGKIMDTNYFEGQTYGETISWADKLIYRDQLTARECVRFFLAIPEVKARFANTPLAGLPLFNGEAPKPPQNDNDLRIQVTTIYREVLEREPDEGGLNYFVGLLKSGSMTLNQVRDALKASDERYVQDLYVSILKRKADASGLQYYLKRIQDIAAQSSISEARDWAKRDLTSICENHVNGECGGAPAPTPTPSPSPSPTPSPTPTPTPTYDYGPVVEALYREVLGRSSDAGGKAYFINRMTSGASQEAVRQEMANSDEGIVVAAYRSYLRREPDSGGVAYYISLFARWKTEMGLNGAKDHLRATFQDICSKHLNGECP